MKKRVAIWVVLSGVLWLASAMPAAAQGASPYTSQVYAPQNYNSPLYNSAVYNGTGNSSPAFATPPVSPYLNLGYNQNGISNYQSLVKPMIDEQDSLQRQAANLQKLQRQLQKQGSRDGGPARPQSATRFLNYSHYYGAGR